MNCMHCIFLVLLLRKQQNSIQLFIWEIPALRKNIYNDDDYCIIRFPPSLSKSSLQASMHFLIESSLDFVYFQTIMSFCLDLQDLGVNYFHAFFMESILCSLLHLSFGTVKLSYMGEVDR
jgi:hypothetical protein